MGTPFEDRHPRTGRGKLWRTAGLGVVLAALSMLSVGTSTGAAATCTPTGFVRDGIDLTAAMINPTGKIGGTINANGCNIGIYYDNTGSGGTVAHAEVFGSNYFGIVNNGANVKVNYSVVHDIGENPFDGSQHGVAIAFINGAAGQVQYDTVYRYQKGGIEVVGVGEAVPIKHNTVAGLGPVDFIAQNGIEVGDGALSNVNSNSVTGNSYTGANSASSGGILVFGGPFFTNDPNFVTGIKITANHVTGNDVGIWVADYDTGGTVPSTPTNITVLSNVARNDAVNNTSGWGDGTGYQAGIADTGNGDHLTKNHICGVGYTPVTPPPHLFRIDDTFTANVHESGNTSSCPS
jgi:hypothetical protein